MYLLVCCVIMHHRKFCFGASICHLGSNVMFYANTCYICGSFGLCCICCLETFSIGLCGLVCVVNGLLYADDLLRNKSFIRPHTSSYRSISPSLAFLSKRYTRRGCWHAIVCLSVCLHACKCGYGHMHGVIDCNCTCYRSFMPTTYDTCIDLHLQCDRVWPWAMSHNSMIWPMGPIFSKTWCRDASSVATLS